MKSTSTNFGLTFQSREIEVVVVKKLFTPTFNDETFKELCQDVLVVKG